MSDRLPVPGEWHDYPAAPAGMKRFMCSYDGPDGRYGIELLGTDQRQILEDNCVELPGLKVDGELVSWAEAKRGGA